MDYTPLHLMRILKVNFGFGTKRIEGLGDLLVMNSNDAFRYSLVTGSPYLFPDYGYSPFGGLVTFNHRNYSFNFGLFTPESHTGMIENNGSPRVLGERYPKLFRGKKFVIFRTVAGPSNIERDVISHIEMIGEDPSDFLLTKVYRSGSNMEHFLEYLAVMVFCSADYLTETQIPWSYHGRPDFGAYRHPRVSDLFERGIISEGCVVQELSALCVLENLKRQRGSSEIAGYEIIVGEAKGTTTTSRMPDYLSHGLCDNGIEIMPGKTSPEGGMGLLRVDIDSRIRLEKGMRFPHLKPELRKADHNWLEDYLKLYLLANLPIEEIHDFIRKKAGPGTPTSVHLVKSIRVSSWDEMVNIVDSRLPY